MLAISSRMLSSLRVVGVHHHQHGVTGRPGADELRQLADVGAAGGQVGGFGTGIGVGVVDVQQHPVVQPHLHVAEALRCEAIGAVALVPLDPGEVVEGIVAQRVEAIADGGTAAGGRAVGMVVAGVERSVVVEVFLHVNQRIRRQFRCQQRRIGGGVAAGDALRQAGDVIGEYVEDADAGLGVGDTGAGQGRTDSDAEQRTKMLKHDDLVRLGNSGWTRRVGPGASHGGLSGPRRADRVRPGRCGRTAAAGSRTPAWRCCSRE